MSITGSVAPDEVAPGASVTFSFVPGNASKVPMPDGVVVVVELPAGFTPGTVTASGYTVTVSGNTITLTYDQRIDPGEVPPPFSIRSTVGSATGTFTIDATITATGFGGDPTPANNLEELMVDVVGRTTPSSGGEVEPLVHVGVGLISGGLLLVLLAHRRRRTDLLAG